MRVCMCAANQLGVVRALRESIEGVHMDASRFMKTVISLSKTHYRYCCSM